MFDSHEELCEYCKVPLKKGFTAPLVTFKGGGWGASNNSIKKSNKLVQETTPVLT
jgi:predicted nucleic acid-binding Zn ribbon protein